METNCRSRRRSAARILNPSIQTKRQKCISEFEDDSNEDNFPTLASPDTSDHHPNPENLHNIDPPDYAPSPIHNGVSLLQSHLLVNRINSALLVMGATPLPQLKYVPFN